VRRCPPCPPSTGHRTIHDLRRPAFVLRPRDPAADARSPRPALPHCVGPKSVQRDSPHRCRGRATPVPLASRCPPSAAHRSSRPMAPSAVDPTRCTRLAIEPAQPTCWSPAIHQRARPNVQPNAGVPDITSCHPRRRTLAVRQEEAHLRNRPPAGLRPARISPAALGGTGVGRSHSIEPRRRPWIRGSPRR
jgi:hypothetical protein